MTNRIAELRIKKGLSQRMLAKEATKATGISVTYTTVSRLESDETPNPRYKTLVALSKFLGVSIEYLMGISDDKGNNGTKEKKNAK